MLIGVMCIEVLCIESVWGYFCVIFLYDNKILQKPHHINCKSITSQISKLTPEINKKIPDDIRYPLLGCESKSTRRTVAHQPGSNCTTSTSKQQG